MSAPAKLSPAMRQVRHFKDKHPGYVLFFRMGDFYEMFWEDAEVAHKTMGVTLTARNGIPMAGVPHHSIEGYLRRMIRAGHRVAMCEQVQDPKDAKSGQPVERDVTRLVTPGTLTDEPLLEGNRDNYLAAYCAGTVKGQGHRAALAWVDVSTGQLRAVSAEHEDAAVDEADRLRPAEVLVAEMESGEPHPIAARFHGSNVTTRPGWEFGREVALEKWREQWGVSTAAGFGFGDDDPAVVAVGVLVSYLEETQRAKVGHLRPPVRHVPGEFLTIDPASYRALEVDRTTRSGEFKGSLLHAIDRTHTSMGGRLLRRWLRTPLADRAAIGRRQAGVAALLAEPGLLDEAVEAMADICDVERIVARVTVGRAGPRDLAGLGRCLSSMPGLLRRLDGLPVAEPLRQLADFAAEQAALLKSAIQPEPAQHLRDGGVIAKGYDDELDRLRSLSKNAKGWLAEYQKQLTDRTGIPSLKIGYNKVFNYYIEVTNTHKDKVPPDWTRKQTLKGAERYITQELQERGDEVIGARENAVALEQSLFEQLRVKLLPHVGHFQALADALAELDVLAGLAVLARERRYCRPTLTDTRALSIDEGRHPVLEQHLGGEYVANDVTFEERDALKLITGPNMAGKSTFIRQTALIVLLAQIGSYVPAKAATVGVADRLFARVGASDELHAGASTFMVEMLEAANLLNNATDRSVVILDEIGRGTSTLDGLSLAWAIAEDLAGRSRPRALFATHYHELTALAETPGYEDAVGNLNVAVREWKDEVVFLHRIVPGRADKSYGLHVARLAGVPKPVLARAKTLLDELTVHTPGSTKKPTIQPQQQLALFAPPDPDAEANRAMVEKLRGIDVDDLTPKQAHDLLRELSAG